MLHLEAFLQIGKGARVPVFSTDADTVEGLFTALGEALTPKLEDVHEASVGVFHQIEEGGETVYTYLEAKEAGVSDIVRGLLAAVDHARKGISGPLAEYNGEFIPWREARQREALV